jgi:hypothetical protein
MVLTDKSVIDSLSITIQDDVIREYVRETYDPLDIYTADDLAEALAKEED